MNYSRKLGDVLERVIDHRGKTPKKLGGEFTAHGIPVISAKNLKDGALSEDREMRFVDPSLYDRWMPEKLRVGDVLLTSEAPLGEVAFVEHEVDYCLGQRLFALRADPHQIDSRYLYHLLQSQAVQHELRARATGTTAQGIRQSELLKVELAVPPLEAQMEAVELLGLLDRQVVVSTEIAAKLTDLRRTIYEAWFRPGAAPAGTATRPGSGLRHQPAGGDQASKWPRRRLQDVANVAYGASLTSSQRRDGPYEVFGSSGKVGTHVESLVSGPGIIVGRKGHPGRVIWSTADFYPIDTTFYLVPKQGSESLYYLFHALGEADLPNLSSDSAVPGLNRGVLERVEIPWPTEDLMEEFAAVAAKLDEGRFAATNEAEDVFRMRAAMREAVLAPYIVSA